MKKTIFSVPKMDCPSEENLIRLALKSQKGISLLQFDLNQRQLVAIHETSPEEILEKLKPLNFDASYSTTVELTKTEEKLLLIEISKAKGQSNAEAGVLKIMLAINAFMFFFEIVLGYIAQSTGLIADSMDMFADSAVYCVSLYAVGKAISLQYKAARISGYLQMLLSLFALSEVIRRFIYGSNPEPIHMMWVSILALIANVICLVLISRHRDGGVHMKASLIFSANDVVANIGVLLAGALVYVTNSPAPDLLIGFLIAIIVFRGALSILRISKQSEPI